MQINGTSSQISASVIPLSLSENKIVEKETIRGTGSQNIVPSTSTVEVIKNNSQRTDVGLNAKESTFNKLMVRKIYIAANFCNAIFN